MVSAGPVTMSSISGPAFMHIQMNEYTGFRASEGLLGKVFLGFTMLQTDSPDRGDSSLVRKHNS